MMTGLVLVVGGYYGATQTHGRNVMRWRRWFGSIHVCWRVVPRPTKKSFFECKRLGIGKDYAGWERGNVGLRMAESGPVPSKTRG